MTLNMNARSIRSVRLWVLLALVVVMALGSFWVLEVMRRSLNDSMPHVVNNEPDYFVEKFSFVKISKAGQARYHISGEKLTHNPQDSSYEIVQPALKVIHLNQPPLTIRADRALADQDGSKIHLHDHVQMDRPASASGSTPTQHFQMASDYLLVLPDTNVVQTNRPVKLLFGSTTLSGTGMYANHVTREFRLANNVHGTYQPARQH